MCSLTLAILMGTLPPVNLEQAAEQKADVVRGFCFKKKMWENHFKQNIINSRIKPVGRRALTFYQNDFIKNEKNNTSILNNSKSVLNDALISICLWKNSSSDKFNVIWIWIKYGLLICVG